MAGTRSSGDERASMMAEACFVHSCVWRGGLSRGIRCGNSFSSRLKSEGSITTKRVVFSSLVPIRGTDAATLQRILPRPLQVGNLADGVKASGVWYRPGAHEKKRGTGRRQG